MNGSISLLSIELTNCYHVLNVEIDGFRLIPVLTDVVGLKRVGKMCNPHPRWSNSLGKHM